MKRHVFRLPVEVYQELCQPMTTRAFHDAFYDPLEGMSVYDRQEWVALWIECVRMATGSIITNREAYEALLRVKEALIE